MKLINELKALSEQTRLRIICILYEKDMCVCEVMDVLDMLQSRISRHLNILKQAGLIKEERRGKWVFYKIKDRKNSLIKYIVREFEKEEIYFADKRNIKKTLKKQLCPMYINRVKGD